MTAAQLAALLAAAAGIVAAADVHRVLRAQPELVTGALEAGAGWPARMRRRVPAIGDDVLAGIGAGLAALLLATPGVALLAAVGTGGAWRLWLHRRAAAAARARERGMPMLARALADGLRGGHSVRGALALCAGDRSLTPATRAEIAGLSAAVQRGAPLSLELERLAGRGGAGLRVACGTVAMHLDAGGALARELERLARDGEAALRIEQQREAATAQARATVRIVAALPVLAMLGAELTSGGFVSRVAGHPLALALLLAGLLLELLAIVAAHLIAGGRR